MTATREVLERLAELDAKRVNGCMSMTDWEEFLPHLTDLLALARDGLRLREAYGACVISQGHPQGEEYSFVTIETDGERKQFSKLQRVRIVEDSGRIAAELGGTGVGK